jgi:hypothetical protein
MAGPKVVRIVLIAALIAAIVVAAIVLLGGDDGDGDETVKGPPGDEFTLLKPDGWEQVSRDELALIPGKPLAVLRRDEREGLVTVSAPSQAGQNIEDAAAELDKRLSKALPDFRKVGARIVEVEAGRALLYSYVRTKKATAHTILVVPGPEKTYTINAVVPAGAEDAARDVGEILNSFDT